MKNISPNTHSFTLQERMPHDSIHKKSFFFEEKNSEWWGGVLPNPKLSEKPEIFLDFFLEGGGAGSHIFQKGVFIKDWGFLDIFAKRGGLTQSKEIFR